MPCPIISIAAGTKAGPSGDAVRDYLRGVMQMAAESSDPHVIRLALDVLKRAPHTIRMLEAAYPGGL
jgi:hypothetical protein